MLLLIAALVAVAIFMVGYLIGKGTRSDMSIENKNALKEAVLEVKTLRRSNLTLEERDDIALGALKDIEKGTPSPQLIASSAINTLNILSYKELN